MGKAKPGQRVGYRNNKALKGTIKSVHRGTANVHWDNGTQSTTPTGSLFKLVGCSLFGVAALVLPGVVGGVYYLM